MGLTKRIFIDKDPAYEAERRRVAAACSAHVAEFAFRVAGKRKNREGSRPHWDPFWPNALGGAASQLGLESVNVNGGVFFRTQAQAEAVEALAEQMWHARRAAYAEALERVSRRRPAADGQASGSK
jgi:hypothetical protein